MLCYVMLLCHVMLCHVMLCYITLRYVMLCYVVLCYVMLCYIAQFTSCAGKNSYPNKAISAEAVNNFSLYRLSVVIGTG